MSFTVERHGFTIVTNVIDAAERQQLPVALGTTTGAGRRGILALPAIAELARSTKLLDVIRPYFTSAPFPIRAIYFNKSVDTNWLVPWHQDLTLAVRDKIEVPGFTSWSRKEGVHHVQAPVELLQQMLTLRLHLDDTDESNGALRVLPSSHLLGRLSADCIQELRSQQADALCIASAGDALLMRPLLLHASSRSTSFRERRVLHIEYASFSLPNGLNWHNGFI